jgi:histidinol-phosphate aminotransferase
MADPLRWHGDQEIGPGLVDAAVNVRLAAPPPWLGERLAAALGDLGAYPDPMPARRAVAARHARPAEEVLLTAGAAEAFVLLARALRPRRAVCLHPSFTEPEAALRAAGVPVERVVLRPPFRLDEAALAAVPADADLVLLGNPTNPTSVLHPAATLAQLARPGRVLVVDEAFADFTPGEPESLAARRDLPGLVVVRSLTKMWGLAGLRVGYLLAEPALVEACAAVQPAWSVSTPALVAAVACSGPAAVAEADRAAATIAAEARVLAARLDAIPGVQALPPAGPFVLVRVPQGEQVRRRLRELGVAVRRGDTFPGLSADWLRLAVRDNDTDETVLAALRRAVGELDRPPLPPAPPPSPPPARPAAGPAYQEIR